MEIITWGDWILWASILQAIAGPSGVALTASQNCLIVLTSSNLFAGFVALKSRFSMLDIVLDPAYWAIAVVEKSIPN